MAPPHWWLNRSPSQLGEGLEELAGQQVERRRPVVELAGDPAAEVVDRVVAAPEDPVVRRQPVVVELVAAVVDALPVPPADRGQLLGRQRLGHQRVVVDRHRVPAHPLHERGERVGAEGDPPRTHGARRTPSAPPSRTRPCRGPRRACPRGSARRGARRRRRRPQASRAGSTRALSSRVQSPARYVGESTSARIASRSRYSPSPRLDRPPAATPPGAARSRPTASRSARSRSRCRSGRPTTRARSRFCRPSRSRVSISSGNRCSPLSLPWVSDAEQKPPLRPDAAQPMRWASSSTTSRPGSRSLARTAVQSPE